MSGTWFSAPIMVGTVSGVIPVDVNYSDNVGVTRVELYVTDIRVVTDDASPFALAWNTTLHPDGAQKLTPRAYDAASSIVKDGKE